MPCWATKVMIITFFCFPASITLPTACGGITITVSQNHVKPGHLDFHSYMFLLIIQILFNWIKYGQLWQHRVIKGSLQKINSVKVGTLHCISENQKYFITLSYVLSFIAIKRLCQLSYFSVVWSLTPYKFLWLYLHSAP